MKTVRLAAKNNVILCIETTTEVCSVSIGKSGECIAVKSVNEQNAHGTVLTVLIENILEENNLAIKDLSAVAYSSGPGSYTGLRIGLSVAKGICFGAGIPLIAVSTLQHIASTQDFEYVFPMLDARRMEVYGALMEGESFIIEPFSCIVNEYNWDELLSEKTIYFLGNGMPKSKEILSAIKKAHFVDDYIISAASMCSLAETHYTKQDFVDLAYHAPFYLKEANVTEAKKKLL